MAEKCDNCDETPAQKCTGCGRTLCKDHFYGVPGSDDEHDAREQGRCVDCARNPA